MNDEEANDHWIRKSFHFVTLLSGTYQIIDSNAMYFIRLDDILFEAGGRDLFFDLSLFFFSSFFLFFLA